MMNQKRLLIWVLGILGLVFSSTTSWAQEMIIVKGTVTDKAQKVPLAGVTVKQEGGKGQTAVADAQGHFEINAPMNSRLVLTMTGYESTTVQVHSGQLHIEMDVSAKELQELVVIGYGTQKKASLTTAITSVNAREMSNISTSNLSNILAGRASGVFVQTGTGVPGTTSAVRIRSSSSWNSSGPIYVIDGIVRDQTAFDALDANQIEDITILKDAASAAIYGSRSSDGVLVVTTRGGKKGKPVVQLNSVFGVYDKPAVEEKYISMDESMDMYNAMHTQPGDAVFNDYDRDWMHQHNPDGKLHINELYQNPFNQRHSLNVSGGSDFITYFVAGSFYDEKGFLPHMNYQKYNLRSNIRMNVSKSIAIGLNLNYNNGLRKRVASETDGTDYNITYLRYIMSPLSFAYIDGKPIATSWVTNPVEAIKNGGYRHVNKQALNGMVTLEYKVPFVKGLTLKGLADLTNAHDFTKAYGIQPLLYKFKLDPKSGSRQIYTNELTGTQYATSPTKPYIGNENGKTNSYQLNGIATYDRRFGNHNLNVVGVYEQADGYYTYSSIYKYNFPLMPNDQFPFASRAAGDTKADGFETYLDSRVSYVGRINYDFASKYLVSVSLRADGSSKFSKDNRWGYFPAASLGWVLSKENFFNLDQSRVVDLLKLRLSYGTTGNDNIPAFMFKEFYNASTSAYFLGDAGALRSILAYNGLAQANYTWESAKSYNAGVDLKILKHWELTADIWNKQTYDILGQRILQTPVEFGSSYPVENYGKMDAKGLDLELGYVNGRIGKDFSFNVKANFGLATTNVVLKDKALGATPAEDPVGKPLNYLVGYDAVGILRTDADVASLPAGYKIFGVAPAKGMMNFRDVSGPNGKPDGLIDNYDKVVLNNYSNISTGGYGAAGGGLGNAPVSYGLTLNLAYRNISFNALLGGLAGYKVNYNDPWNRANINNIPFPAYYADSYSETNTNSSFPMLYNAKGNQRSDYSVVSKLNTFNGAFLRLKNVNLSYNLPSALLRKSGIASSQVFVGGTNLFCLRQFKLYDPELFSFGSYPVMATVSVGLNVQF